MNIDISILPKGPMILTGSKVLELIQDNSTPAIDLLVRESIQNSADAVLGDKDFVKVQYQIGSFNKADIGRILPFLKKPINKHNEGETCDFIAIADSNTTGLLGSPKESTDGSPNNLYNLVYDIMNRKSDGLAGGSHGIGKTVYYRYGVGICFYYSRTYEHGRFTHKLAGALIQDEKSSSCYLGANTSGIAYFGRKDDNGNPLPIYDEMEIGEFLSLFGLSIYDDDKTGTMVIIPFLNVSKMLSETSNDETDMMPWMSDIKRSLSMSVQRWYFPRINNESFNGKYLKIAINNTKVELNKFFQILQELYNGTLPDAVAENIRHDKMENALLGKLMYKVFSPDELGMEAPNNLPSPKYLTDSSVEADEKGLLFYTRKPGMIINYDNTSFDQYPVENGMYLIGVFKLADETVFQKENLGEYMRKTEEANHKEWIDINCEEFPVFKKKKPFKKICSEIKKILSEKFKETKPVFAGGESTVLQKKMGQKLMPPSGFGTLPELPAHPKKGGGGGGKKTKKKCTIVFAGPNADGTLGYDVQVVLKNKETFTAIMYVRTGATTLSFNEWEKTGFSIPCRIKKLIVPEYFIGEDDYPLPTSILIDESFAKRKRKEDGGEIIYKIRGLESDVNKSPFGVIFTGYQSDTLTLKIHIDVEIVDNKCGFGFDLSFGGDEA